MPENRIERLEKVYGLKKEIDLSFLTGREVGCIAVGLYQVAFAFDEDVAITVEAEFHYCDNQSEFVWKPEPGAAQIAARIVALLGVTIQSFQSNEDGTLILRFSNGHSLSILDSSKEYESYNITRLGQTIVV